MSELNLLLVDDHALFREGLRLLLANISPGVLIDEAATIEEAAQACSRTVYRMVLLDLGLTETGGLETLVAFRRRVPEYPVVVLSSDSEARLVKSAIDLGAVGYVPKSYTSEVMIAALRFVMAGGIYLPPCVLDGGPAAASSESVVSAFERLSPRQGEIARLVLQGLSNKAIARRLDLSEGTVKAHVSAVFQVIGARSRVEAVLIAARHGIKVN